MSNDNHSTNNNRGLWYTYLGEGGAAVVAFLWITLLLFWLFSVLEWGGKDFLSS